jgi:hypothetical protein
VSSRYSPVIMGTCRFVSVCFDYAFSQIKTTDFKYFERDDWFEEKIHSSGELLDLDHEFRDSKLKSEF